MRLVFDTGAALTTLVPMVAESIGYTSAARVARSVMRTAARLASGTSPIVDPVPPQAPTTNTQISVYAFQRDAFLRGLAWLLNIAALIAVVIALAT